MNDVAGSTPQTQQTVRFTDGDICDEPIDKRFHGARGILAVELYAGEGEHVAFTSSYLVDWIVRGSIEALAGALLQRRRWAAYFALRSREFAPMWPQS